RPRQPGTRAAPGLRPPGHYEPAARSSLTERRKASREARPGAGDRLKGDESKRRGGAPGGVRARPRRAPRLMSAELVAPPGAPPPLALRSAGAGKRLKPRAQRAASTNSFARIEEAE